MIEIHKVDMITGEILSRFTFDNLDGSYDSRISVKVLSGYRIKISGSVHKFIMGFNVFGGPNNIKDCCKFLVLAVMRYLKIELPPWHVWEVSRVDVAYVFDLKDRKQALEYIGCLRFCNYPRRQLNNYGNGLYFPGKSTTLKIYHKGDEFRYHDMKKLLKHELFYGYESNFSVDLLAKLADRLVRFEVEVRKRKMKYDNIDLRCGFLNDDYFKYVYESEILKIFKEGGSELETVKNVYDVRERLYSCFSKRKANNLFNVWSRIQLVGVQMVKNDVSRTQWYYYTRDFKIAGVSLYAIKNQIENNLSRTETTGRIYDFIPLPESRYNIDGVFLDLRDKLKQLELVG